MITHRTCVRRFRGAANVTQLDQLDAAVLSNRLENLEIAGVSENLRYRMSTTDERGVIQRYLSAHIYAEYSDGEHRPPSAPQMRRSPELRIGARQEGETAPGER